MCQQLKLRKGTNMHAERTRVLELVKSGVLSIEQADELIDALQTANQPEVRPSNQAEFRMPQPPRPPRPPRAPRAVGGGKFSFEQMIELENHGINANFIRELANAGLEHLTWDEVIALGAHGIRPEYVKELKRLAEELEIDELSVDQIVALGNHGVKPKNVREMLESGLFDLTQTRTGVTRDRIRQKRDALQSKYDGLRAKYDKLQAKLERSEPGHKYEKLEEMRDEVVGELEEVKDELSELLEEEIEAEDS
jgi:hypothetical protein